MQNVKIDELDSNMGKIIKKKKELEKVMEESQEFLCKKII